MRSETKGVELGERTKREFPRGKGNRFFAFRFLSFLVVGLGGRFWWVFGGVFVSLRSKPFFVEQRSSAPSTVFCRLTTIVLEERGLFSLLGQLMDH